MTQPIPPYYFRFNPMHICVQDSFELGGKTMIATKSGHVKTLRDGTVECTVEFEEAPPGFVPYVPPHVRILKSIFPWL